MPRRRAPIYLALALMPALLTVGSTAQADEIFAPTAVVTGFGTQQIKSFDISFFSPRHSVYLLADRTNAAVDVVDTKKNKLIKQLTPGFAGASSLGNDFSGPNGVLVAEDNDIWVGDGGSKLWVIDLGSGHVDTIINTGGVKRADELCFDPEDHMVMIANDADSPPFVTIWDSRQSRGFKMLGKITFSQATNGIEQCQWDPRSHRFLLNLPEINGPGDDSVAGGVAVINPKDLTKPERTFVVNHNSCAGPQGMALGPTGQVLLGCNAASGDGKFSTVIIDDQATRIVATLNNESGSDEVWFNPGDGHYFLARSAAVEPMAAVQTQLLGVIDSASKHEDQSVFTANTFTTNPPTPVNPPTNPPTFVKAATSHSVAADSERNQVYVPIGAGASNVCSSVGGSDTAGCIAVYTTKHDDKVAKNDHDHDHDDHH